MIFKSVQWLRANCYENILARARALSVCEECVLNATCEAYLCANTVGATITDCDSFLENQYLEAEENIKS